MKGIVYREVDTTNAGRLLIFESHELETNEVQRGHVVSTGCVIDGQPVRQPITGASMLGFCHDADYIPTIHGPVLVVY